MKNNTSKNTCKNNLHAQPSKKTRWAYWMQAIEPTSEALNKAFPDYHPQWVQQSQMITIGPANFTSMRQTLGMTRKQCAAYLRVRYETIGRWETGLLPVPFTAFELLRLIQESVKFKLSHNKWDGWFISDDGMLTSPDIGGNGFTPELLNLSTMMRSESALLRRDLAQLQTQLDAAITENTALRGMLLDSGVTDEVAAMQEKINALMTRINTARIIPFPALEEEQPQEKVA
ncbi:MAG TPA: hypothetical protein VMV48_00335 [Gallionellaceae bacterium]|nr:hypothetical protein [Gallionellaceae bacterium]